MSQPVIAITGGYLSQNMGATGMTIVCAEQLKARGYAVELFSKYAEDDAPFADRYQIALRPANQFIYSLLIVPALVLAQCIPSLRRWVRRRWYGRIAAFYDVGGITFSADRGIIGFLINVTWLLLPLLLDIPVVKGSQAMGPFNRWYLRLSLPILRRAKRIYCRGAASESFLCEVGIPFTSAADIAFLLKEEQTELPGERYVSIVPSAVVMRRYNRTYGKGAYEAMMTKLIEKIALDGTAVVLLAHSYRRGTTLNNNDYPIARALYDATKNLNVILYDVFGKSPGQLKRVLVCSEVVLTSRFHAMIAALSSCVPVVVATWSHKYREVLEAFDLQEWALPWKELSDEKLFLKVSEARLSRQRLSEKMRDRLPIVRRSAMANFDNFDQIVSTTAPTWPYESTMKS